MPTLSTSNGPLHYEVIDHVAPWRVRRQTILFHHGIGASAEIWAGWLPRLIDRYRVVTWEMRGYGRSTPAPGFKWTMPALTADIFALADAAGVKRFHLVGESIGGTIALAAALARADRVQTLTISNGAHVGTTIQNVEKWRSQLGEGMKAWSDNFMHDRFHDGALSERRWAWFSAQQEKWAPDAVLDALGVLVGTDLTAGLANLRTPVLLLHPDGSPFIPVPMAAELQQLLPNARLRVFEHARHGLPFSHADECATALRAFLDSRPAD
jgi:pimeloyl-ACP methyl ester carboxylesterase